MEQVYGYRGNLTDDDILALEYQSEQMEKAGEFRLGAYEPDFTVEDYLMRGSYEIGDRHMRIYDPVWGEEYIGEKPYDALLIRLSRTPLFRRLQSIEQLTLGPRYATMPNSMYFSRWEHAWGSLAFVRKMMDGRADFDDRQKMVFQLRTLLSDVAHTAFSHLGDWMFQGMDGGEDLHDQDLKAVLRSSGVGEIVESYGFSLDETVFPDVDDWVECPSPDLCVDRVDYGLREILRWGAPSIPLHMHLQALHNPQSIFEITPDNQLVFKDAKIARYFAAGFSLLPTEHWSHPVHRMQLQLFQSAIRSSVVDKIEYDFKVHPREAMYGIDNALSTHLHTWPMLHLENVMRGMASAQRRIFVQSRRADLNYLFENIRADNWTFPAFPDPTKPYSWQSKLFNSPYPATVRLREASNVSDEPLQVGRNGLIVNLPPLKARAVDPPVIIADGNIRRLSEFDPSYAKYLEGQRAMMAKSYQATVLMRSEVARSIVEEDKKAHDKWPELLRRPRSAERLASIIREAMPMAAVLCLDRIHEVDDRDIEMRRKVGHQGVLFGLR